MDAPVDLMARERPLVWSGEFVVGLDEVGRGALAGPVVVGAVALGRSDEPPAGLTDSKLLVPRRRESLVGPLVEWADDWSLGWSSAVEIDAWGVREALAVAATRAVAGLARCPTHVLVDGPLNLLRGRRDVSLGARVLPSLDFAALPATTVVGGDRLCATIAAASVLAKVHRDRAMVALDLRWPIYGWSANKGYGSPGHLAALRAHGPCPEHRRTWRLPEPLVASSGAGSEEGV